MLEKRGWLIFLVIATVMVFVGVVWAMATYLPIQLGEDASPTATEPGLSMKTNCVHSVAYWKDHSESYPAQMVIAGKVYKTSDIRLIFADNANDRWNELQAQLAGAYLNIHWGADQSYIEPILFEAYGWLVDHPSGNELSEGDREEATRLYDLLQAYNQGLSGVAACELLTTGQVTATSVVTEEATTSTEITSTETTSAPSATQMLPSETNAVSDTPTYEPIYTQAVPTATPQQPTHTQAYATLTPSRTLAPSATFTPINTTQAPTPTNTSAPTNTPTFPASPTATITPPPPP